MTLSLDQVVRHWEGSPSRPTSSASFSLAGVRLDVESDDPRLFSELATILGAPAPCDGAPAAAFSGSVQTREAPGGFGLLRLAVASEGLVTPADFLLGLSSPEFPFHLVESPPAWTSVAFKGDETPAFALRGADCLFRLSPQWPTAVALLLFQRLMRLREDAIFFHASSVAVEGRGAMFVGPKGAGKSTIALSLAARGHDLLGDENACYLPATGELLPFRRPVGIKPGPRARAVDAALDRLGRDPDRDGPTRIDPDALFGAAAPRPVPLASVVFLETFSEVPRLRAVRPGRDELAALQPVGSSLINAPHARRVFQMARLLSGSAVYRLSPGAPDETADLLEEALGVP